MTALLDFDRVQASKKLWARKKAITESVWLMGLIFIALADLLLLVRCLTSVAEEKRRNTWDDLLLTAQSFVLSSALLADAAKSLDMSKPAASPRARLPK